MKLYLTLFGLGGGGEGGGGGLLKMAAKMADMLWNGSCHGNSS